MKSKRNTNDKNDYNLNDTNVVTNNYDENDKNVVENTKVLNRQLNTMTKVRWDIDRICKPSNGLTHNFSSLASSYICIIYIVS